MKIIYDEIISHIFTIHTVSPCVCRKNTTLETLQVTATKKDRQTGIYKYGEEEAIKGLFIKLVTLENKTQISVLFVRSNFNTVNRKFTW